MGRKGLRDTHQPDILNAFRRILQALRVAAVQTQTEAGVSAAQLFVLSQLVDSEGMSIKELAQATMTDRSSVADVVARLTERRLLRRTTDPDDRRRAIVRLTAGGRALLREAPPAPTELLLDGLAGLTASEVQALARGLGRLCDELGLTEQTPAMLFESATTAQRKRRSLRAR